MSRLGENRSSLRDQLRGCGWEQDAAGLWYFPFRGRLMKRGSRGVATPSVMPLRDALAAEEHAAMFAPEGGEW